MTFQNVCTFAALKLFEARYWSTDDIPIPMCAFAALKLFEDDRQTLSARHVNVGNVVLTHNIITQDFV